MAGLGKILRENEFLIPSFKQMTVHAGDWVESEDTVQSADLYSYYGIHYGCFSEKWEMIYLKIQLYPFGAYT